MTRKTTAAGRSWLLLAILGLAVFAAITVWVEYANGPTQLDSTVLSTAVSLRTTTLTGAVVAVTTLGSFPVVAVVAAIAGVVLWWQSGRLLLALTLLIAVGETAAVVLLIKEVVGRDRPPVEFLIGAPSTDGSFPSGHTANGSLVYLLTAWFLGSLVTRIWLRRLLLAAAVTVAVSIGLTRIYLGYHWATDVLGGWALAATVCCVAGFAVRRLRRALPAAEAEPHPAFAQQRELDPPLAPTAAPPARNPATARTRD